MGKSIYTKAERKTALATRGTAPIIKQTRQQIERSTNVDELRTIADQAKGVEGYLRKRGASIDQLNEAVEIRLRSERRLGELWPTAPKAPAGRPKKIGVKTTPISQPPTIKELGFTKNDPRRWTALAKIPVKKFDEYIEDAKRNAQRITGNLPLKLDQRDKIADAKEKRRSVAPLTGDAFDLHCISVEEAPSLVSFESIDAIVTDPPYPKEYVDTFSSLARFALHALKPGGSLVCMTGHLYLPQYLSNLCIDGLNYQWICAYLTPGGQAVQIHPRRVNTFWKPLLWFVKGDYAGRWIGDVCKSSPNDNDKTHHHWGQSESGMADVIDRFTEPGQVICDPFCGGGTTGVVALAMGRKFIGLDVERKWIETTGDRLAS